MSVELIDLPEVERMTRMSRATIYRQIKAGAFPRAVELGPKKRVFLRSEIEEFLESRIAARKAEAA